jgi:ornithine cyclodeaminase/alanine dehydrogenase-like protein (mu-crystallin family)
VGAPFATPGGTLVLSRSDVAALLTLDDCIAAVEDAFRAYGHGRASPPGVLGLAGPAGGFHVKTAALAASRNVFAAKVNSNFPGNPERSGRPAIQGLVALFDADSGVLLAVMDSIEITLLRTAAATALAARLLAREDARVATVCGCGAQGRVQLRALARVRHLERAYAFDRDRDRARAYAAEMSASLCLPVEAVDDFADAAGRSDVCITCTPSRAPLLGRGSVRAGAFVAAVGADSAEKQELQPELLAASTVVVDLLDQAATIGEVHHALEAGLMTRGDVHAELSDVLVGTKPGRRRADEVIVFDSTGTALQDVAAAALAHERALAEGRGQRVDFGS